MFRQLVHFREIASLRAAQLVNVWRFGTTA